MIKFPTILPGGDCDFVLLVYVVQYLSHSSWPSDCNLITAFRSAGAMVQFFESENVQKVLVV